MKNPALVVGWMSAERFRSAASRAEPRGGLLPGYGQPWSDSARQHSGVTVEPCRQWHGSEVEGIRQNHDATFHIKLGEVTFNVRVGGTSKKMSQAAFIGVLACARAADGAYPESERSLLNLICQNHVFTREMDAEEYQLVVKSVRERIDSVGWKVSIKEFLGEVPAEWAYATLLTVIDLCLIDARQDKQELACIAAVAGHFGISAADVANFMRWFRTKNGMDLTTVSADPVAAEKVA